MLCEKYKTQKKNTHTECTCTNVQAGQCKSPMRLKCITMKVGLPRRTHAHVQYARQILLARTKTQQQQQRTKDSATGVPIWDEEERSRKVNAALLVWLRARIATHSPTEHAGLSLPRPVLFILGSDLAGVCAGVRACVCVCVKVERMEQYKQCIACIV